MAVRVGLEINEVVLQQVIEELHLKNPPTFVLNARGVDKSHPDLGKTGEYRGMYYGASNTVEVATGNAGLKHESLTIQTRHLKKTLLHELRHAWQREHWDDEMMREAKRGEYWDRLEERDARAYADDALNRFPGLVKVTRHRTASSRPRLPR